MSRAPSKQNPDENPEGRRASRSEPAKTLPVNKPNARTTRADPAEFGKETSPVRERMAKAIKETSPEERIKKGR